MRGHLRLLAGIGLLSSYAWSGTLVGTTEVSRIDIHRGGVGAPATGPTEENYVTWYNAWATVRRDYVSPTSSVTSEEPVFTMCSACGSNAGYELKIYSSQDPRVEKFDKPIMVVPGFDPDYGSSRSGNTFENFAGMMSQVFDENNPTRTLVPGQNFLQELYNSGYDIVFIRFYNPNIDINVNAMALQSAMLWLNSKSSTLSGDDPAILGASMGGLIARQMLELAGKAQGSAGGAVKAGLFISFDAPNRGAEIPMSIQAMVRYIQSQNSSAQVLNSNIGSVAAGQMLLSQRMNGITSYASHTINDYEASGTAHGNFMLDLNNPANVAAIKNVKSNNNTRPIRTMAISCGSKNGSAALRGLPAGVNYMSEDYATLYYRCGFSNANLMTSLFTGNAFSYAQWKYSLKEPVFAENLPGGNRNSYKQLDDVLASADYGPRNWTGNPGHCFIPTASALGLKSIDINSPSGWLASSGATLFDEIHAPELNQDHVTITMQNKAWIMNALRRYGPHVNRSITGVIPSLLQ
jgi:hypothetical protein